MCFGPSKAVCGAFYNPRKATCGDYWTDCYGYCDFEVEADPFSVAVNGTVQLNAKATYADGSVVTFTSSSSRSSSSKSATVGARIFLRRDVADEERPLN
jgi:hypothetical protein